ncbi:F-box/LRR-repeat protein [Trifolium repens]|nr:F-box/LRR-repeat protein [Trifolium repens]
MPANGLLDFYHNYRTLTDLPCFLTSLTCSYTDYLRTTHMFLITDCFPSLQLLDLNHCHDISTLGLYHVLHRCLRITHLNLAGCSGLKLRRMMKFQVPKLEVLNLSYSTVDDRSLNVISNSCRGILQLLLESCDYVTHNGVNRVLQNCTQLTEINLNGVKDNILHFNVASMVLLRPSLKKITLPNGLCWVR